MTEDVKAPPPLGQTSYSIQHRCTQWHVHDDPEGLPYPCPGCYSLMQFDVVIPHAEQVSFTELHKGGTR